MEGDLVEKTTTQKMQFDFGFQRVLQILLDSKSQSKFDESSI
jgi:hypothetical protein